MKDNNLMYQMGFLMLQKSRGEKIYDFSCYITVAL